MGFPSVRTFANTVYLYAGPGSRKVKLLRLGISLAADPNWLLHLRCSINSQFAHYWTLKPEQKPRRLSSFKLSLLLPLGTGRFVHDVSSSDSTLQSGGNSTSSIWLPSPIWYPQIDTFSLFSSIVTNFEASRDPKYV